MIGTFKGFGSNATTKLSSSLIPRNWISIAVLLVSEETEDTLAMWKQGICSASLHQCSNPTLKVDHAVHESLQHTPPSGDMLPVPISIYGGMQKLARFPPVVFKNEASMRGKASKFLSIQCKAQGNPGNDCFLKTSQLHDRVSRADQPAAILSDWE